MAWDEFCIVKSSSDIVVKRHFLKNYKMCLKVDIIWYNIIIIFYCYILNMLYLALNSSLTLPILIFGGEIFLFNEILYFVKKYTIQIQEYYDIISVILLLHIKHGTCNFEFYWSQIKIIFIIIN